MRFISTLLLAAVALLAGGGALYFLTGLIFTPRDRFDGIAILLPLIALSIGNALFICLFCVALLIRRGKSSTLRTPSRFQAQTVTLALGFIAMTLGLPSLVYIVKALTTPDPGLRLIFLPLAAPGVAIAAFCLWRITRLRRLFA